MRRLALWLCPSLGKELAAVRERNIDLVAEVRSYINAYKVTNDEMKDIVRVAKEHIKLVAEMNAITVYLRDNDPAMAQGRYAAMSFSEMVISLLKFRVVPRD